MNELIIGFHSVWFWENQLFFGEDEVSTKSYGDHIFYPLIALKNYAKKRGVTIGRINEFTLEEIDAFVFHEVPLKNDPYFQFALQSGKPMFLYNYETKEVYLETHKIENHEPFIKVFTNHDQYLTSSKYIKINPFCLDVTPPIRNTVKSNLLTMISKNKWWFNNQSPNVLYNERLRAIEWFEKHHPTCFDFYGYDWDPSQHTCYKGITTSKIDTLSKYKFALCYENIKDVPGYITEKILDCFRAGCVPIYLGANNIHSYIPADCFIDKRQFSSYQELYDFIDDMSNQKYMGYLQAVEKFMCSQQSEHFSVNNFVNTMWTGFMSVLK